MRAAIYTRVSTKDQNAGMQETELRAYCKNRKWEIVEVFSDTASGGDRNRPALDRLMATNFARSPFTVVLVWKFDRFARSVSHLLSALEMFRIFEIQFVSMTEGIDTTTPMGRMVFTILGAVAELERSLIRERVSAGMRNAQARGKGIGRPRLEFTREGLIDLRSQGQSIRGIARYFGVSPSTIIKALEETPSASQPSAKPGAKTQVAQNRITALELADKGRAKKLFES